jgi:hypothetical protein
MNLLNSTTPSTALVQAFRRTLRPLVRLMLASGVTYPLVSELLKQVFVEVADREFGLGDKAPTDSRISLISGVHRKDVRRLRSADQSIEEVVPNTISFGGKLVTTWLTDERFRDEEGRPRPLSKVRTPGAQPCFEDLVESRRTDIRLRVVLDEWLRLGIVHIDAQDRLVLNTDAFVPQAGIDEKLFFFAHNLHDHAAAATDNLLGSRAPQLERSLMYDGLTEDGVALLDKRARQLGNRMLQELNRLASEREAAESTNTAPRRRFTCGVYFYSELAKSSGPDPKNSDSATRTLD